MSDQIDKLIARNHQLIAEAECVRKETAKRLAKMRLESENLRAQTLFLPGVYFNFPDIRPYKSL